MISTTNIDSLLNGKASVHDRDGNKVGSLGQIYLDDTTSEPSWATVNTGLFGMSESFVPLKDASAQDDELHVNYTKDQIQDAPTIDEDRHLEPEDEEKLYEHYGIKRPGTDRVQDRHTGDDTQGMRTGDDTHDDTHGKHTHDDIQGKHTHDDIQGEHTHDDRADTGRRQADADAETETMVRSEERLNVGTESHESGKVRLRKYVVTENVTQTVPVSREEVRVERVPLSEGSGEGHIDDGGDETEVTLHEERPVVEKEAVPVEEVRLGKETVTDEEAVTDEVRKEKIDTDEDMRRDR